MYGFHGWIDAQLPNGERRLDSPDDFVRIEIQAALRRKIPVIPVLVGRASVPPKEKLPRGVKPLSRRNAAEARPGRHFQEQLNGIVRELDRLEGLETKRGETELPQSNGSQDTRETPQPSEPATTVEETTSTVGVTETRQ